MDINNSVALVTGANRGLGRAFVRGLLDRGARTVYATSRTPHSVDLPGVRTLTLDITDPGSVRAAAEIATDVDLLINNAGVQAGTALVDGSLDALQGEMETNFLGHLRMIRAFAPTLASHGGGAVVNILSALSWFATPGATSYHLTKAAAWAMTNGVRLELEPQGTLVTGVHLGLADTDMTAGFDAPKLAPAELVAATLDGVEAGAAEVLADDWSRGIKSRLHQAPEEFYETLARDLAAMGA